MKRQLFCCVFGLVFLGTVHAQLVDVVLECAVTGTRRLSTGSVVELSDTIQVEVYGSPALLSISVLGAAVVGGADSRTGTSEGVKREGRVLSTGDVLHVSSVVHRRQGVTATDISVDRRTGFITFSHQAQLIPSLDATDVNVTGKCNKIEAGARKF